MEFDIKDIIPKGFEIDVDKSNLQKSKLVLKKIEHKLPVTNKECVKFLPENCYYIDALGGINNCKVNIEDPNTIATKEYAEAFLALMQLIKFRDIWNDGWTADWGDSNWKYIISFYNNKKSLDRKVALPDVLNFKAKEIRDKFSKQFDSLIMKAKPLL